MPDFFYQHAWAIAVLWAVLFVMDYVMTMRCARMYRNGVNEKIVFEGSLELNPIFEKDVDKLRMLSPRFLAILVVYGALIRFLWIVVAMGERELYAFFVGAMIGPQLAIHMRHIRNYVMFRMVVTDAARGRIEYARPMMLKGSAGDLAAVAAVFGILGAMTMSWFPAGAVFGTAAAAWKHYRLAQKASGAPVQTRAAVAG